MTTLAFIMFILNFRLQDHCINKLPEKCQVSGGMPVQTRLGGGYTGGLELGDPGTIKIVMTDGGVNILDH